MLRSGIVQLLRIIDQYGHSDSSIFIQVIKNLKIIAAQCITYLKILLHLIMKMKEHLLV